MPTTLLTAPVKIKITKEDGTSELRRLTFRFEEDVARPYYGKHEDQVSFAYHLSLSRFLLRSLADLYPELPVGSFSNLVVFTVKDEDGDMVNYHSEEEFVAAMYYESWKTCLRVEVTVLGRAPAAAAAAAAAGAAGGNDVTPAAGARAVPAGADDASDQKPAATSIAASSSDPAPPSEAGSVMSFVSNMSGSSSSSSSTSSSSSSASSASSSSSASVASVASSARSPAVAAPAPAEETAAAVPALEREIGDAAPSATDDGTTAGTANANGNGNNSNEAAAAAAAPSSPVANPAAAGAAAGTATTDGGFGDPATPARAFLTQVLPGLADVLARSMYAAQWVPDGVPNTVSAASTAARDGENPLGPAAQGLAAAAAAAAAATAAGVASTAQSVAATVQERAESAAAAAGAPAPTAVPDAPRVVTPASAAAPATSGTAGAGAATDSSETPPVVHHGVQCDMCDKLPLVGIRYKCAVRSDFDLCEDCEGSAAGRESPFPFLKIRTPAQAPAAIVCLLKPDQPASAQEAATTATNKNNDNNTPRGANNANGGAPRSFAPGQAWRGSRSKSNPHHGGWGEGRRNGHRWMRDLARRQQQQFDRAASAHGTGIYPPGVEFMRGSGGGGGGGGGCSRPPWCGPRMARRRDDPAPAAAAGGVENKAQETPASAPQDPTPPASVADSVADSDADRTVAVEAPAVAVVEKPDETATTATAAAADAAAAAAAPVLTSSALEQATAQPAEYHDMLAASMRSLADSMTASYPASASAPVPQDVGPSKPRASQDSNKPQSKPMARFVTDVSISDGSPLPPNTRFVKTWCMRNDGQVTFPPGAKMMPVGGDMMGGPEDGVSVEQRAPGEEFHVSVTLTTPPLSGRYIGYWRLRTADGQNFGHRVWADVLVTGGTASLIDEGTMDGDWDLVNMQRLSKAVEDTGKDDAEPEPTPTPPENATSPAEPLAASEATAAAAPASRTYAPGQAWAPAPRDAPKAEATDAVPSAGGGGFEESKSSDEGGANTPAEQGGAAAAAEKQAQQVSSSTVPPAMATKWHRELCSLAEMGFENTPRNVQLLEKHVVESGSSGMERVLHELLSWREVSIQ